MEINRRLIYISYLVLGLILITAGLALNEQDILAGVFNRSPEEWYNFLMPWIGNSENGLPTPW